MFFAFTNRRILKKYDLSSGVDYNLDTIIFINILLIVIWIGFWYQIYRKSHSFLRCLLPNVFDRLNERNQIELIRCVMGGIVIFLYFIDVLFLTVDSVSKEGYSSNINYVFICVISWSYGVFITSFDYIYGDLLIRESCNSEVFALHSHHISLFIGFCFIFIASTYNDYAELVIYFRYIVLTVLIGSIFKWYFVSRLVRNELDEDAETKETVRNFYHICHTVQQMIQWHSWLWPPLVYITFSQSIENEEAILFAIFLFSASGCFISTPLLVYKAYVGDTSHLQLDTRYGAMDAGNDFSKTEQERDETDWKFPSLEHNHSSPILSSPIWIEIFSGRKYYVLLERGLW